MDSIELIHEFLQDRLGVDADKVVPDALLANLGVDSLMMLELMFEFEDRFGIRLPSNLQTPRTVGDMVSLVNRLIDEQKS